MNQLQDRYKKLLLETDTRFHRYMYDRINWSSRMVGLTGPRGVGKRTLVLQYIKENLPPDTSLYVTAEDFYFADHRLLDLADDFVKRGGKHLFIDEIHRYKDWSKELKLMYDYHPELQVVFTGSSVLDINKGVADLSRRAVMYHMQGLSFREYLRQGYYPFSLENQGIHIQQIVNLALESDIPQYAGMNVSTGRKLKQLLAIIAKSVPFKPNISSIATALNVSRNSVPDYCLYIEEAGLIAQLRDDTSGIRGLGKVDKIYLDNTNLIYNLGGERAEIGNIRETFFFNQMRVNHDVITSSVSDFCIGDYTFEIGGRKKGKKQIEGVPNAFVIKDDIEFASGNIIPLWQFGFDY
ncbi:MAG: AAA family ATPase [Bacteroidales bacterium]|nr:AAA family ATPase [Bacteroidales bacterium]